MVYSTENIDAKGLCILSTLVNNDLTVAEVANQLCITPIAVYQHLNNLKDAFGVTSDYGLVKAALVKGHLKIDNM